jgi:hypothetical protein
LFASRIGIRFSIGLKLGGGRLFEFHDLKTRQIVWFSEHGLKTGLVFRFYSYELVQFWTQDLKTGQLPGFQVMEFKMAATILFKTN